MHYFQRWFPGGESLQKELRLRWRIFVIKADCRARIARSYFHQYVCWPIADVLKLFRMIVCGNWFGLAMMAAAIAALILWR